MPISEQEWGRLERMFDDKLTPVKSEVSEHKATLYGNGHVGIKTDVDRLKVWSEDMKKEAEARSKGRLTIRLSLAVCFISSAVSIAIAKGWF